MCNACGNVCCGSDEFEGCGCDSCGCPECVAPCLTCGDPDCDNDCDGGYDDVGEDHVTVPA